MTLVETLMTLGIGSIVALVLASLTLYSSRSFYSMFNYTSLNQGSRVALDNMTQEIRQARGLNNRTPTYLEFKLDSAGSNLLSYTWNEADKTVTQIKTGTVNTTNVLLRDCTFWTNSIYRRNIKSNSWDLYEASTCDETKVIHLQWICARARVQATNSESVQSMNIVIRKKGKL